MTAGRVPTLAGPRFPRNAASHRVAAKAGFVLEAPQPHSVLKGGVAIDATLYAAYRPGLQPGPHANPPP